MPRIETRSGVTCVTEVNKKTFVSTVMVAAIVIIMYCVCVRACVHE